MKQFLVGHVTGTRLEVWLLLLLSVAGGQSCEGSSSGMDRPPANSRSEIDLLPGWSLAQVPDVGIGVAEGEPAEQFASVVSGELGPHGIYVLDNGHNEVRIFERSGRHLMSLGGEGEGPGEFRTPTQLVVSPDSTITVWDRGLRRLTVFGHDGDVVRTVGVRESLLNPRLHSVLRDGSFILSDFRYPPNPLREAGTGTIVVTAYSAAGEVLDTLEVLTGPHVTGVDAMGKPFSHPDLVASATDGVWVLRVDTALIARLGPGGDTLQTVEWETPNRDVTEDDLDEYGAWRVDGVEDPAEREEGLRHIRDPGFAAERLPAAVDLETDGAGRLWLVERYDWDRIQSPTWLVFAPSGRVIGRWVEPLESLALLDADETSALVRFTDQLGIHKVELREMVYR